jgi:hypothetical protein
MKLSILIPTYKRSVFLLKNLELLYEYIKNGGYLEVIEIIVSNNNSPDTTNDDVLNFKRVRDDLQLRFFNQKENIGLKGNALFVLREAIGEYIMFLGDDDYIELDYLRYALEHLSKNRDTYVILPSFIPVNIEGIQIGKGRDVGLQNSIHRAGFKNCRLNSWRGHQLSGVILRRENIYDSYCDCKVDNIYLFIYFVAYSCLNGDTYHITKYPVRVTQPGQENKDWNYGKDGLINEVFDNYKKLKVNYIQKTVLQLSFFHIQNWRLFIYKKQGLNFFLRAFFSIWMSKNSTLLFKFVYPIDVIYLYLNGYINKYRRDAK